ncbi:MAG: ECF-type sigma factor [Acidobacteriota bacterium]
MTFDEIATTLAVSPATVKRDLKTAKIWLLHELRQTDANSSNGGAVT